MVSAVAPAWVRVKSYWRNSTYWSFFYKSKSLLNTLQYVFRNNESISESRTWCSKLHCRGLRLVLCTHECKSSKSAYSCLTIRGGQANRKSANSWAHSAIARPQISYVWQSANRKSANFYDQSANHKSATFYKILHTLSQNSPTIRLSKRFLCYVQIWIKVLYAIFMRRK